MTFCSQNERYFADIDVIVRKLLVHINHIFLVLNVWANTVSLYTTATRKNNDLNNALNNLHV